MEELRDQEVDRRLPVQDMSGEVGMLAVSEAIAIYPDQSDLLEADRDVHMWRTVETYRSVADTAIVSLQPQPGELLQYYQGRLARTRLEGVLAGLGNCDDDTRAYITENVAGFARELLMITYVDSMGLIRDFAAATNFLRDAMNTYIDHATEPPIKSGPAPRLSMMIDRLLLPMLGVDIEVVAQAFDKSVASVLEGTRKIKNMLAEQLSARPDLPGLAWDNDYIQVSQNSQRAAYVDAAMEYYGYSSSLGLSAFFNAVMSAPETAHERDCYAEDPAGRHIKRLADFSELLVVEDAERHWAVIDNGAKFIRRFVHDDQHGDLSRGKTAVDELMTHAQGSQEAMLTVVYRYIQAHQSENWDDVRDTVNEFWLVVHSTDEELEGQEDMVERIFATMLSYAPDLADMSLNLAYYRLRGYGRHFLRQRHEHHAGFVPAIEVPVLPAEAPPMPKRTGRSKQPPSDLSVAVVRLYAKNLTAKQISERLGEDISSSFVTYSVKRVLEDLRQDPTKDPDLLAAVKYRHEERKGHIRNTAQLVAPRQRPEGDTISPGVVAAILEKAYREPVTGGRLLEAEEETELAVRTEAGVFARERLDVASAASEVLDPTIRQELEWIAADGEKAFWQLVEANLGWASQLAAEGVGRGLSYDDLVQEARLGLIQAMRTFDFTRGGRVTTYSAAIIRRYIYLANIDETGVPKARQARYREVGRARAILAEELGRPATDHEVAKRVKSTVGALRELEVSVSNVLRPTRLDSKVGEDGTREVMEEIADSNPSLAGPAVLESLQEKLWRILPKVVEGRELQLVMDHFGLRGKPMDVSALAEAYDMSTGEVGLSLAEALQRLRDSGEIQELEDLL